MKQTLPGLSLLAACTACAGAAEHANPAVPSARPNVVVIMTDDLGYGDTTCYGAKPEYVKTPNIDRLAAEGIRFTDGHSSSSVCTPSRASILTGDYPYRNPKGWGILDGDAPIFIQPGTPTLPAMFKQHGYATGIIGKWHLGLGNGKIDWNGEIKPGPNELGFDDSFIIPATPDRVPTVFVRNHRVDKLDPKDPITISYGKRIGKEPTGELNPELATVLLGKKHMSHLDAITEGISRIGYMTGGKAALWKDCDLADTLFAETTKFLGKHAKEPFFLYLSTNGIHEPRTPNARFAGKSGCGTYGDYIEELDDLTGRVMAELKRLNLDENTLVLFTTDNGGSHEGGDGCYIYKTGRMGHECNGVLRGCKGTVYEGGTRVPFIVRWPGHVPAGKVSPALVSQTDLMASFANLLGTTLPEAAARDSMNVLDALLGKSETGRTELLEHRLCAFNSKNCALRQGNWKFYEGQLFDLSTDLSETKNLAKAQPARAKAMAVRLKEIQKSKKTRP